MKGVLLFVMTRAHALKCHFDRSVSGVEKSLPYYNAVEMFTSRFALVPLQATGRLERPRPNGRGRSAQHDI